MLEPVDVRQVWETAEPMIAVVAEHQEWRPADVYSACVTNNATLFMPDDDRSGVLALRVSENQFTGELFLFVWVAYSPDCDAQEEFSAEIEEIARKQHCVYIEFKSKRSGFMRRGGWTPGNTIFRKQIGV